MSISDWANLFDQSLCIQISKPWQIGGSITDDIETLHLVQGEFGGTMRPKNPKSLELRALPLYHIASILRDQPCALQQVYQAIDYIRSLKEAKTNDGEYQDYQITMRNAIVTLKSVYSDAQKTRRERLRVAKQESHIHAKQARAIARSAAAQVRKTERKRQAQEKARVKRAGREKEKGDAQQGHMICRKCVTDLPIDHFNKATHSHTGYSLYCKECCKRDHYLPNRDEQIARTKQWIKDHPEETKISRRRANFKARKKPERRVRQNMSKRIKQYLKATKTAAKWRDIVSCTPRQLVSHLEAQFTSDMNWSNYGTLWHIDHIIPCAAFDWSRPKHLEWCWHHKNLRPLLASDNILKCDTLSSGDSASQLRERDLARLRQIVGADLVNLGITSREEYDMSWESSKSIQYLVI